MASVRLRRFRPDDAAPLAALVALTLRVCNARDYPREVIARIESELSRERLPALSITRDILVAVDSAVVVATGALERDWIHAVFVHPERQREGIGRLLVTHLEAMAEARGASAVHLHATIGAIGFYQQLGYEILRVRRSARYGQVAEMHKVLAGVD